ncbi:MAG: GNAT family N-acetyltransferase [Planctomycetes bacterium]|nr:GNAT family N-acetyltransferase [Planctomycetota bacterium]
MNDATRELLDAELQIRPATAADSAGIVALVGMCFAEYPGCILDVDREETSLLRPAAAFNAFWVLEWWRPERGDGRVMGTIGASDHPIGGRPGSELKKLYLHPALRGRGIARVLVGLVEDRARELGHTAIELWSDTRFTTAHRVYERLGYRATGAVRALHDLSATREFHYVKQLASAAGS